MNWHNVAEQLGPYVWSAYGFATAAFLLWVISSYRRLVKTKQRIREQDES
jgi:heme exporter protein CcmD